MTDSITLFGFAGSTYCRTARMACHLKGLEYALKPLEFRAQSHRALHPFLKMPVMRHGNTTVFETLAICSYLDSLTAAGKPQLQPRDAAGHVAMLQWISAYNDYFTSLLLQGRPEEGQSWPEHTERYLAILNDLLKNRQHFAGNGLSFADLFFAPAIAYALEGQGFENMLSSQAHLQRWWQDMRELPAFKATQP